MFNIVAFVIIFVWPPLNDYGFKILVKVLAVHSSYVHAYTCSLAKCYGTLDHFRPL